MKDEEVDQYGQMVEQHIEDLLDTHLNQQDIQDSTQLSKMEQLRKVDPRGVLELLRMLFYDFDEQEQEKLSVIDEWPHNSEFKDKKDFLVNQKMKNMDYNDLLIKNIFFGKLNLSGANFSKAAFRGCDLSQTTLDKVDFTGATTDKETKWPDRFDPKAAGIKIMNINMTSDICEGIVRNPKYKEMWNNYWNMRTTASAYLKTLKTEELMILMCRSGRHLFYPIVQELLARGYHLDEIYCAKFDHC